MVRSLASSGVSDCEGEDVFQLCGAGLRNWECTFWILVDIDFALRTFQISKRLASFRMICAARAFCWINTRTTNEGWGGAIGADRPDLHGEYWIAGLSRSSQNNKHDNQLSRWPPSGSRGCPRKWLLLREY